MKYIILLSSILYLVSCGSNKLPAIDRSKLVGKNIVFCLTEESRSILVEKSGLNLGETMQPNNVEVFMYSVMVLGKENQLNLRYIYNPIDAKITDNLIVADLKSVKWDFGFTNAVMKAELEYTLRDGTKIPIIGTYKTMGGGTKSENLLMAMIDANGQILNEIAD